MRLRRRRALNPRFARGMSKSPRSAVRNEALDLPLERLVDHVVVAGAADALAGFLLHEVIAAGFRAANPARARDAEAFRRALVGLHLRHGKGAGYARQTGQSQGDRVIRIS